MKAGRELDALVAEKVFAMYVDMVTMTMAYCSDVSCCEESDPVPAYSTDIAAAWVVVEHMKKELFSSRHRFVKALREEMRVLEDEDLTISASWWIFYLTPEKICLAALKAVQS